MEQPEQKSLSELGIKAVALDIYGTVLATNDIDNSAPPRDGIDVFFEKY